jgi:endonuclease/exonuclease/phosphatase family metal-dependent hydrolase
VLPLRVMTLNLRRDVPSDGSLAWQHRRGLVAALVRDAAPDVLGTQEGLPHQLADLDAALPSHRRFGAPRQPADEACAIYWNDARFKRLNAGDLWLSDAPHAPGSRSWGNRLPRLVTWARLLDRASLEEVTVANTHLDHESQAARILEAEFIATRLPGAVLMGDFNEPPGGPVHRALAAAGWQDAGADSTQGTFHGFGAAREAGRIDWVMAPQGFDVRSHRVDVREGPAWPSDHHPVIAELFHAG